ncbi:MAG: hypothetical protein WDO15_05305 [Bacteroidota bacterium]
MKILFPLFIEDFIHHIYKEEDTLFKYIKVLERAQTGNYNPARLYYMMERHSLQRFAMDHEAHDDEMTGIRKITNDYQLFPRLSIACEGNVCRARCIREESADTCAYRKRDPVPQSNGVGGIR